MDDLLQEISTREKIFLQGELNGYVGESTWRTRIWRKE